jgi:hypothetical protein
VCNDVLHDIRQKIRYRQYPCPTSSVFDTQLSVFVSENIRIRIRIRSYPYSNSNPNKNMKTNMVSVISVRIRSDYIPNPSDDGPGAVLTSSFEVEILRPCCCPRPGRIPPKVESMPRVLLLPIVTSEPAGTVCL